MAARLLTINGGSSSLKFALFAPGDPPERLLSGVIERIGTADGLFRANGASGEPLHREPVQATDHRHAVDRLIQWLEARSEAEKVAAVGHRVVHGGSLHTAAERVTPELLAELRRLCPLDPDHMPGGIALLEAFHKRFPRLPQVACFDTGFHHDMPRVARLLPIPRHYEAAGVRRYGFHGLSYSYLMAELARTAGAAAAAGRLVLAHLGSGASLAAVRDGKCVDTTMALTPAGGLVMSTRTGDIDPGLLVYLMRSEQMTVEGIDEMVNRRCGLLGVSETSADMRDLLLSEADDPRAADAVALFCHQAKKWLGALAAVLGGLDTLVFAGGIGENAPRVRGRICNGLEFLGIRLDEARNAANAPVISADGCPTTVRVIPTDEERIIAQEAQRVLGVRAPGASG